MFLSGDDQHFRILSIGSHMVRNGDSKPARMYSLGPMRLCAHAIMANSSSSLSSRPRRRVSAKPVNVPGKSDSRSHPSDARHDRRSQAFAQFVPADIAKIPPLV
jgi:hypothetical protein